MRDFLGKDSYVFDNVADAAGRWFTGRLRCHECEAPRAPDGNGVYEKIPALTVGSQRKDMSECVVCVGCSRWL